MNLSLYLLLTPPMDSESLDRDNRALQRTTHRFTTVALDPVWPGAEGGPVRHQASRRLTAPETKHTLNALKLRFAARVVFNAMGFLLMTAGLLLLLQAAQAILG